ncbi:MAG: flavodoxin domain-containing protein [Devosia sp.]
MSIVIVYDSMFGNTRSVAEAIATELGAHNSVRLLQVGEAKGLDLADPEVELLIVGSPTRGFRPTPQISEFCEGLDERARNVPVAMFDTRIALDTIHPVPLRWVVEAGGYAADRIAQMLAHKGMAMQGTPAGFVVAGTEGPLMDGEIDRARHWAHGLTLRAAAA